MEVQRWLLPAAAALTDTSSWEWTLRVFGTTGRTALSLHCSISTSTLSPCIHCAPVWENTAFSDSGDAFRLSEQPGLQINRELQVSPWWWTRCWHRVCTVLNCNYTMLMSITPSIIHGAIWLGCNGQVASIIVSFPVFMSYSGLQQACINKPINVQYAWALKGFISVSEQESLLSVPTSSPLYTVHHQVGISTHKRIRRPKIISKTASLSKMDSTQFPQGYVMCEQNIIWKKKSITAMYFERRNYNMRLSR